MTSTGTGAHEDGVDASAGAWRHAGPQAGAPDAGLRRAARRLAAGTGLPGPAGTRLPGPGEEIGVRSVRI